MPAYYNEVDPFAIARVGRVRGYGNAVVPQVAQAFIESYMDVTKGCR